MYDSLHEENLANQYSKFMGRAYALFVVGAGVANILSGFIADRFGLSFSFYLSVIPCVINILIIISIREPHFHKPEAKERIYGQLSKIVVTIAAIPLIRVLVIVLTLFSIIDIFKFDFGQVYMLSFVYSSKALGILWAVFAFAMAAGGITAHKFRNHIDALIIGSTVPIILMLFIYNSFNLVLFMVQAFFFAALVNRSETLIQNETPSHVRASIISVLSSLGRLISIPAALIFGWLYKNYGATYAVRFISVVAIVILGIWILSRLVIKIRVPEANPGNK
jgi:hypothetical protein